MSNVWNDAEIELFESQIKQFIIEILNDKKKIPYVESRPFFPMTITIDIGDFYDH